MSWIASTRCCVLSGVLLLGGCSLFRSEAPEGATIDASLMPWLETMGGIGAVAVIPPSEDVFVGDMFLYLRDPDIGNRPSEAAPYGGVNRWGFVETNTAINEEYLLRHAWPQTPPSYQELEDPSVDWEAVGGEASIFAPSGETHRLRHVTLGVLSSTVFSDGPLARLVPFESVNLVRGDGWSDDKVITITAGDAESYSISTSELLNLMLEVEPDGTRVLKPEHRDSIHLLGRSGPVWIRVVSEVIYARGVDVTVQTEVPSNDAYDATAGSLQSVSVTVPEDDVNVEGAEADAPDDDAGADAEEAAPAGATVTAEVVLDPQLAAFARAAAINKQLSQANVDDRPNSFVRFVSVTPDSVAIRRVFRQPVAIGVRGITFQVVASTGEVQAMWPMGWGPAPEETVPDSSADGS